MAASSLQQMAPGLISRSKMLINNDLKRICRDEGLASSGVKALLQSRVIDCTVTQLPSDAARWTDTRRSNQSRRPKQRPRPFQSLAAPHREPRRGPVHALELLISSAKLPHHAHAKGGCHVERLCTACVQWLPTAASPSAYATIPCYTGRESGALTCRRTALHVQGQPVF
jgi:hypothetical protein